ITLYDIEYAIENRIYPADWENKSYADQIRRFMEQGGWDNEMYVEWARNYYDGDWYGIYGIDVEKGCGFSKGRPLTDSEIKEILDRIGDITEARKEIVEFALNAVGKVGYQYGGKASGTGMGARFGSSTPDEKGRRNGLDCSGFVQWVYRSAIGVSVPGSTAGYSGYPRISKGSLKIGDIGFYEVPGSEDNHMGIYLGMDSSGNETWVHCSGSSGATYGTGNFKYYISLF
ncbi:MAG: C40 family peptidase, partial [Lachnospiraceae bacterium]|nr:C40 family peptidase [Lachnospiraceae bacterium]